VASGTKKGSPTRDRGAAADERTDDPAGGATRPVHHHETPRWRKIEILRERRALRDLLDDLGDDDVELDDEIFGFSEDEDAYFRVASDEDDAPGDDLDDGEFDDDEDFPDED
jgi:hypothetical protein